MSTMRQTDIRDGASAYGIIPLFHTVAIRYRRRGGRHGVVAPAPALILSRHGTYPVVDFVPAPPVDTAPGLHPGEREPTASEKGTTFVPGACAETPLDESSNNSRFLYRNVQYAERRAHRWPVGVELPVRACLRRSCA
jgi:hypothetical protein